MTLSELQKQVHVGKDKRNDFGGYNYRTAEGILAAIKAHMPEGGMIVVTDDIQDVAGQIFVTSTATIHLPDCDPVSAKGHALHPLTKKGMDPSQITGAASSYARKYALAGLMALDDGSVDPDAAKGAYEEDHSEAQARHASAIEMAMSAPTLDDLSRVWTENKNLQHDPAFQKAKDDRKAELAQAEAA